MPECVIYDTVRNRYLISNVGSGEILQMNDPNTLIPFVKGLNQPKGMVLLGDTLYVVDFTDIVAINASTGVILYTQSIPGAVYLNDICSGADGILYITDSQDNKIYAYSTEYGLSYPLDFAGDTVLNPDGIYYDNINERLIIVSFRENSPVQAIDLNTLRVSTLLKTGINYMDGIIKGPDNSYYVSSWGDISSSIAGVIYRFNDDFKGPMTIIADSLSGPSDICADFVDNKLVVPNMMTNEIFFLDINPGIGKINMDYVPIPRVMEIFPNPAIDILNIKVNIPYNMSIITWIYDYFGEVVDFVPNGVYPKGENILEYNIDKLTPGLYTFEIELDKVLLKGYFKIER
jgi:hypothetical protein